MTHSDPAAFGLSDEQRVALADLLHALVDQERAETIVAPRAARSGFWFGAGDLVADPADPRRLWLCGRYRDAGDARRGTGAGRRGWKLAVLRSDGGAPFEEVASFGKDDLATDADVLSIEGSSLQPLGNADGDGEGGDGWELLVSSEKARRYPGEADERGWQKPGTGVWSIDRLTGPSPDALELATLTPALESDDPARLHVKDPVLRGDRLLVSTHPATWASSNTALALRERPGAPFRLTRGRALERGDVWDVAATRVTELVELPRVGAFTEGVGGAPWWLLPYDGAECMNPHERGAAPRGWSCEELGGALVAPAGRLDAAQRVSHLAPLLLSPWGTGSSRYLKIAVLEDRWIATWQQARDDGSQPLVMRSLPRTEVERILGA